MFKNKKVVEMFKKIDCKECKYVCEDERLSGKWWKAYMCNNSESEYFKCLLNVDKCGNKLSFISWQGCTYGKLKSKEGE